MSNDNDDIKLISVVFVHRHGDRAPIAFMPLDKANNEKWPYGLGQLTSIGMNLLENIGQHFRKRYVEDFKFVSPTFNVTEYVVRSTDYDRTIQSAHAFLYGMFPKSSFEDMPNRLWIPPIHVSPRKSDDLLLSYENYNCPVLESMRLDSSEEWKLQEINSQALYRKLEKASGYKNVSLYNIDDVQDPLFCEREHGLTWMEPFASSSDLYTRTQYLFDWRLRQLYARDVTMRKLTGGNLVGRIINKFMMAAQLPVTLPVYPSKKSSRIEDHTEDANIKISHFSAHDTTLVSLLGALDLFDDTNPPYGSTVVFELLAGPEDYYVRAFYNKGNKSMFQTPLSLCDKELCYLKDFVDKYSIIVPTNFDRECEAPVPSISSKLSPTGSFLLGTSMLLIVFIITVSLYVSYRKTRKRVYYSRDDLEETRLSLHPI